MLKEKFLASAAMVPDIKDVDSEKAFIFQQTRIKAIAEFLNEPDERLNAIK